MSDVWERMRQVHGWIGKWMIDYRIFLKLKSIVGWFPHMYFLSHLFEKYLTSLVKCVATTLEFG